MASDFPREAYSALADEMNDPDVPPWNESDWDPEYVAAAKLYADANNLPFPPGTGDFDRLYNEKE